MSSSKSVAFTKWLCEAESERTPRDPDNEGALFSPSKPTPQVKDGQLKKMVLLAQKFLDNGKISDAQTTLAQLAQDPLLEEVDPEEVFAKAASFIQQAQGLTQEIPEFSEAVALLGEAVTALDEAMATLGKSAKAAPGAPSSGKRDRPKPGTAGKLQKSTQWRI